MAAVKKANSRSNKSPTNLNHQDNVCEITTIDSMYEVPDMGSGKSSSTNSRRFNPNDVPKTNAFLQISARPVEINKFAAPNELNIKFMSTKGGMNHQRSHKNNYENEVTAIECDKLNHLIF